MMKPVYESVLEVAEDGLHIPGGLIAEFGLKPGSRVVLDASGACVRLRPESPDEEHIARLALDYLTHNVGDAVAVRRPSRLPDGKWSSDGTRLLGTTPIGRATVKALQLNKQTRIAARKFWVQNGVHPPT